MSAGENLVSFPKESQVVPSGFAGRGTEGIAAVLIQLEMRGNNGNLRIRRGDLTPELGISMP